MKADMAPRKERGGGALFTTKLLLDSSGVVVETMVSVLLITENWKNVFNFNFVNYCDKV